MNVAAEASIGEYVIDGENTGTFAVDDASLTVTPVDPVAWPSFAVPTRKVTSITFKRDTTLHRNGILGWFFAGVTALLIVIGYFDSFVGQPMDPDLSLVTFILGLFIFGGVSTTYDYLAGENDDVIVVSIRTDDGEHHIVTGRMKNTAFVEACAKRVESNIETRNRSEALRRHLEYGRHSF